MPPELQLEKTAWNARKVLTRKEENKLIAKNLNQPWGCHYPIAFTSIYNQTGNGWWSKDWAQPLSYRRRSDT
jgi:hypothetical protein